MRILMGTHYFASHRGGVEIVAGQLFRELGAKGQEVVWIAGDADPPPQAIGTSRAVSLPIFNFVEAKIGLPFPIPTFGAVRKIGAEIRNADILILHDCLYLSNMVAFLLARARQVNTIVIQHIGFVPYKNFLLNALMRLANAVITRPMLSRATQVVFISETTKNFFTGLRFRHPPEVVFNGVDTDLFRTRAEHESQAELRRQYGLPLGRPVILFVGRFVEKKGMSVLKRMVAQRPGYTWAFAGWGPLDPSNWNAPNIRVLLGLREQSVATLYRSSNVLVLPSTGEGFPLVVQEALASGLAVVCGVETRDADPEMSRFVRGVPVYAGDDERTAEEFLAAIDDSLNSEMDTVGKSEQRQAFAIARYSWKRVGDRYLEIASRLVSPQSSKATTATETSTKVLQ